MILMMLGEVVFGGVGCGLYELIGFVILTVLIAGSMAAKKKLWKVPEHQ